MAPPRQQLPSPHSIPIPMGCNHAPLLHVEETTPCTTTVGGEHSKKQVVPFGVMVPLVPHGQLAGPDTSV